jgi:protoheme IX farnesyltransferase
MASEPILATLDVPVVDSCGSGPSVLSAYWMLTKPEVNLLIAITTAAAFWIGSLEALPRFPWMLFLNTLLGTVLVASGAATLNQLMERRYDAKMRRTIRRPIVTGRIEPLSALIFGISLSLTGLLYLALAAHLFTSALALLTLVGYLGFYTPLKRRSPLCTFIGELAWTTLQIAISADRVCVLNQRFCLSL